MNGQMLRMRPRKQVVCFYRLVLIAPAIAGCRHADNPTNTLANHRPNSITFHAAANTDGTQVLFSHSGNSVGLWRADISRTTWLEPTLLNDVFLSFIPRHGHFVVAGYRRLLNMREPRPVRLLLFTTKNATVERQVDLPSGVQGVFCANENWIVVVSNANRGVKASEQIKRCADVWHRNGKQWTRAFSLTKFLNP